MDNEGYDRIVVEKPFGRDYDSSRELNTFLQSLFAEDAIYVRLIECIYGSLAANRPLSGQGNGAEPDGDSVLEHDFQRDLEPQLHRQRPDRLQRNARRGRSRRLLRPLRHYPRRDAEPPPPDRVSDLHGAAALSAQHGHPRREGPRAESDRSAASGPHRRGPVHRQRLAAGVSRRSHRAQRLAHRDLRRDGAVGIERKQ